MEDRFLCCISTLKYFFQNQVWEMHFIQSHWGWNGVLFKKQKQWLLWLYQKGSQQLNTFCLENHIIIFFQVCHEFHYFLYNFFHSIIHQDVVSTVCFESFLSALVALKFSRASFFPLVLPFMFQWFIFSFLFSSHPWLCNDSGRTGFFVVWLFHSKLHELIGT